MNTVTNRVVRLLGKDETVRFMNLTLYQGAPAKKGRSTAVITCDKTQVSLILLIIYDFRPPLHLLTPCWLKSLCAIRH